MQLEFANLPMGAIVRIPSNNLGTIEGRVVPSGIVKQRQHIELANDTSLTVAQGLQTLLSLNLTTQSSSSRLMLWASGCVSSSVAGANGVFILFVDGVEFQSSNLLTPSGGLGECWAIVDDGPASLVTTMHTIELKWQTFAQTIRCRPASANEHASLSVLETIS
jgi:hypothetical protein